MKPSTIIAILAIILSIASVIMTIVYRRNSISKDSYLGMRDERTEWMQRKYECDSIFNACIDSTKQARFEYLQLLNKYNNDPATHDCVQKLSELLNK